MQRAPCTQFSPSIARQVYLSEQSHDGRTSDENYKGPGDDNRHSTTTRQQPSSSSAEGSLRILNPTFPQAQRRPELLREGEQPKGVCDCFKTPRHPLPLWRISLTRLSFSQDRRGKKESG